MGINNEDLRLKYYFEQSIRHIQINISEQSKMILYNLFLCHIKEGLEPDEALRKAIFLIKHQGKEIK